MTSKKLIPHSSEILKHRIVEDLQVNPETLEEFEEETAADLYQHGSAVANYSDYSFLASPLFISWMNSLNYTVHYAPTMVRIEIGTPSLLAVVEDV